jgi:hypothetical protein
MTTLEVFCGIIRDQLTGPYMCPQCQRSDIYSNICKRSCQLSYLTFLHQHLPALMSIPSFQSDHHKESESAVP